MTTSYRTILQGAAFASLLVAGCLAVASASAQSDEFAFRFQFDEGLLSSDAGAVRLFASLDAEARQACKRSAPSAQRTVNSECKSQLIQLVVQQIGDARLDKIYRAKFDRAAASIQTAQR